MAKIIVDVHLKPELLDPQGRAISGALERLGLGNVQEVRQGKQFVIEIDGEVTDEVLKQLHELAGNLLSNPVIENYELKVI
jgi:phosphoribosylformylglycinamidine synthase